MWSVPVLPTQKNRFCHPALWWLVTFYLECYSFEPLMLMNWNYLHPISFVPIPLLSVFTPLSFYVSLSSHNTVLINVFFFSPIYHSVSGFPFQFPFSRSCPCPHTSVLSSCLPKGSHNPYHTERAGKAGYARAYTERDCPLSLWLANLPWH